LPGCMFLDPRNVHCMTELERLNVFLKSPRVHGGMNPRMTLHFLRILSEEEEEEKAKNNF
jgi:hypothetical protein